MGRAGFVIFSALTAFAVGTIEFALVGQVEFKAESILGLVQHKLYISFVLPAPVAVAISAYVSIRDHEFHERSPLGLACQVCFLAYVVYVPLLALAMFLNRSIFGGWGAVFFVHGIAFALVFSIPVLWVQYIIARMAQSRSKGQ